MIECKRCGKETKAKEMYSISASLQDADTNEIYDFFIEKRYCLDCARNILIHFEKTIEDNL